MSLRKFLKQAKRQGLIASIRFKNGALADPAMILRVGDHNVLFSYKDGDGRILESLSPIKEIDHLALVRDWPKKRKK